MHKDAHWHSIQNTCIQISTYSPLSRAQLGTAVTAHDSMTVNSFSQEAVLSTSSHFSNIWLQHHLALVGYPASIAFNSPLGRLSSVPITFQSAAYCGVIHSKRSFNFGTVFTIGIYKAQHQYSQSYKIGFKKKY